jgi:hypothetical protein
MVAVVIIEAVALVVLGILVAGLLRSHAEILRALHRLGVGLEDDASGTGANTLRLGPTRLGGVDVQRGAATGGPSHDVTGVSPQGGSSLHVAVSGTGRTTLLAFLTSGCLTCGEFWSTFTRPGGFELPGFVDRLVVVTKGLDRESPAEVLSRAPKPSAGIPVVMSGEAWDDYEVPVSPYFVLVDGSADRVAGEGAARSWDQLLGLLARAVADTRSDLIDVSGGGGSRPDPAGSTEPSGPRRERADSALASAGIEPGHPSLYGES